MRVIQDTDLQDMGDGNLAMPNDVGDAFLGDGTRVLRMAKALGADGPETFSERVLLINNRPHSRASHDALIAKIKASRERHLRRGHSAAAAAAAAAEDNVKKPV